MRNLTRALKAISDQNRLKILKMLEVRPLCVCEITDLLKISTSTVSKHLSQLRDAGFIVDKKDGKYVEYALDIDTTDQEIRKLLALTATWLNDEPDVKSYPARLNAVDRYSLCNP
jgi:ArsR family transcriptional regulator, arsenate/arsenite/antimonite-responsive transcriptional repressor